MSTEKKQAAGAANAQPVAIGAVGKSVVTGFHYFKGWCHVSLSNGVKGLVGTSAEMPFATMLSLKGSGIEIKYKRLADRTVGTETYAKYQFEWSLE